MAKKLLLFLLFYSSVSFAQEIVTTIPLALKKDRDVFQIVNPKDQQVTLFISDKKNVNAIRLDESMQISDSLSAPRPDLKYTHMLGQIARKGHPILFWSSQKHHEILAQSYHFDTREIGSFSYSLNLKDEKFLQQFSENNLFYMLTVLNDSSLLKIYVFNADGKMEAKTIDLHGYLFFDSSYQKTNFYGVLAENLMPFEPPFFLEKISADNPISLTQSAKKRKCYSKDGKFIISIDVNTNFTQLITIDPESFTASEQIIYKPYVFSKNPARLHSNSFLIGDTLYQIKTSDDEMIVTLKTCNDALINQHQVNKKSPISFKNSDIILENKSPESVWIYKKTSQFISLVNNFNLGISAYKSDGKYVVTMGSVSASDDRQSWSDYVAAGILMGGLGTIFVMFVNPAYESFNAYGNRKVVYINGLFDANGNHLDGAVKPLAFDKMRTFCFKNPQISSETLFRLDDYYYLGYYNADEKNYVLSKYNDH